MEHPAKGRPPGQKKTGGRKKGTKNKITTNLREAVNEIIENNWKNIDRDLAELRPVDRLNFIEKLLSYTLPKLSAVNSEVSLTTKIESLSDHQIELLINNLLNES